MMVKGGGEGMKSRRGEVVSFLFFSCCFVGGKGRGGKGGFELS